MQEALSLWELLAGDSGQGWVCRWELATLPWCVTSWEGWTWTSAPSTPGVLRLKEDFTLGLLGFILFWELWRSSCPTCQGDVLFVYG